MVYTDCDTPIPIPCHSLSFRSPYPILGPIAPMSLGLVCATLWAVTPEKKFTTLFSSSSRRLVVWLWLLPSPKHKMCLLWAGGAALHWIQVILNPCGLQPNALFVLVHYPRCCAEQTHSLALRITLQPFFQCRASVASRQDNSSALLISGLSL